MSDACHTHSHRFTISNVSDGTERKSKNSLSVWKWGDCEHFWGVGCRISNSWWASNNTTFMCACVCGATCEAERDRICRPGSPIRVDVPLSLRLPTAPVNTPFIHRFMPHILYFLSSVVILFFFFLSCALYYSLLRKLSQIPFSSCWRDNVHGRRAASLSLPRWQLNAACLLDSFFSQTGDLRWWRCLISLSPLEGQIAMLCH